MFSISKHCLFMSATHGWWLQFHNFMVTYVAIDGYGHIQVTLFVYECNTRLVVAVMDGSEHLYVHVGATHG